MSQFKHYVEGAIIGMLCLSTPLKEAPLTNVDWAKYNHSQITFVEEQTQEDKADVCRFIKVCKKIAEAIYFEARGESEEGKIAVGSVIMERAKEDNVSPVAVITEPNQFSYLQRISLDFDDQEAYIIAYGVWLGYLKSSFKANHYYNPDKVKRKPKWAKKKWFVKKVGRHSFYYIP